MSTTTVNTNKALWEKGDFTRIAPSMRDSGEALVRDIGVTPGCASWMSGAATARAAAFAHGWHEQGLPLLSANHSRDIGNCPSSKEARR